MADDLEPCPFCGEVVEIEIIKMFDSWSIECQACGGTTSWMSTKDNAMKMWNRRATGDADNKKSFETTEKNKMILVARMFGKSLNEEFDIRSPYSGRVECRFSTDGLVTHDNFSDD